MRVEYHPSLLEELEDAKIFYDERSEGLGRQFAEEFERRIIQIAARPERSGCSSEETYEERS